MKKYYIVGIFNGGDAIRYLSSYGSFDNCYVLNVVETEIQIPFKYTTGRIFKKEHSYTKTEIVYDRFPTYAEKVDGEMYDLITREMIIYSSNRNINSDQLAYCGLKEVYSIEQLKNDLDRLTPSDIERYKKQFNRAKLNAKELYEEKLMKERNTRISENNAEDFITQFKKKYRR